MGGDSMFTIDDLLEALEAGDTLGVLGTAGTLFALGSSHRDEPLPGDADLDRLISRAVGVVTRLADRVAGAGDCTPRERAVAREHLSVARIALAALAVARFDPDRARRPQLARAGVEHTLTDVRAFVGRACDLEDGLPVAPLAG